MYIVLSYSRKSDLGGGGRDTKLTYFSCLALVQCMNFPFRIESASKGTEKQLKFELVIFVKKSQCVKLSVV